MCAVELCLQSFTVINERYRSVCPRTICINYKNDYIFIFKKRLWVYNIFTLTTVFLHSFDGIPNNKPSWPHCLTTDYLVISDCCYTKHLQQFSRYWTLSVLRVTSHDLTFLDHVTSSVTWPFDSPWSSAIDGPLKRSLCLQPFAIYAVSTKKL